MTYERWDVVLARFPFVEIARHKFRPVVLLTTASYHGGHDLAVASMVTSAAESRWPEDLDITDLGVAGLKRSCVVRPKLATLALGLLDRRIGRLSEPDQAAVARQLATLLPLDASSSS